jgi:membrane protein implicated in regulation of membrane protease activity
MKKTIIIQLLIFISAYFSMTPDTLEDNTHVFGLFGSYDVIPGNSIWVLLGAAILSTLNIWLWWPKSTKTVKESKGDKNAEAKAEEAKDKDPIVPKMD